MNVLRDRLSEIEKVIETNKEEKKYRVQVVVR